MPPPRAAEEAFTTWSRGVNDFATRPYQPERRLALIHLSPRKDLELHRTTIVRLTGFALALSLMGGLTANASAAGALNGAGSSLIAPLMANWSADFQARTTAG